ncbi:MAG: SRPBCC family protein [Bacteroidota bacterium]|nr:SRPBCC family protein [Bacteroidota bacterium]
MSQFFFNTEQFLPVGINDAWSFFSSAKNLAVITPPELDFKILSQLNSEDIYTGMLIDYTVKPLFGIKLRWQTEICEVDKPMMFTDRQLKGPYKTWEHTHVFIEKENGILMKDAVKYQLPFGILGNIAHAIVVRKKIENIFKYRKEILIKIFTGHGNNY